MAQQKQEIHRLGAQIRALPSNLESLLSYWLQKCAGGAMPARDALPTLELRPWLGHIALIEIAGETDFRVRLCGTALIRRFGREATGMLIDELAPDIARHLRALLAEVLRSEAPVVASSSVPLGRATAWFCEVALPVAGPDGLLGTILLCSYPVRET